MLTALTIAIRALITEAEAGLLPVWHEILNREGEKARYGGPTSADKSCQPAGFMKNSIRVVAAAARAPALILAVGAQLVVCAGGWDAGCISVTIATIATSIGSSV